MITKEKMKPRGKPFSKGNDARRNKGGSVPKGKASFKADMRRLIEEQTDARAIYAVLISKARAGVQWAIQELMDRGLGKPVQHVEEKRDSRVEVSFPEPNGGPLELPAGRAQAPALIDCGRADVLEAHAEDVDLPAGDVTDEELKAACDKAAR